MTDQERFMNPAQFNHTIGPSGTFSLHTTTGSIEIHGRDTDTVRVTARASHGSPETLPLVVRRSEGGLHIQVAQKGFEIFGLRGAWSSRGIDFKVEVPHGARLDVNAVSSDIEVEGVDGDQTYKSVSGDVEVACHGGRVSLTTVSGDVELRSDRPAEADLTTTSGDVEIEAAMLRALKVRTVSGDAEIRAGFVPGPLHTIESVSGDLSLVALSGLSVEVRTGLNIGKDAGHRLVVGDGAAQLRFRSMSGDVELDGHGVDRFEQPVAAPAPPPREDSLEILRALERGEIDVDEATRRLEGALTNG
jgi:hypothetical protein